MTNSKSSNEKSNRTILSELIKEVCKISGINEVVRGRLNGAVGHYPKYQLISNHTLRRSFASNFYGMEGWNTPMVMEITGHSTCADNRNRWDQGHPHVLHP